jgi:hypothetical protein
VLDAVGSERAALLGVLGEGGNFAVDLEAGLDWVASRNVATCIWGGATPDEFRAPAPSASPGLGRRVTSASNGIAPRHRIPD